MWNVTPSGVRWSSSTTPPKSRAAGRKALSRTTPSSGARIGSPASRKTSTPRCSVRRSPGSSPANASESYTATVLQVAAQRRRRGRRRARAGRARRPVEHRRAVEWRLADRPGLSGLHEAAHRAGMRDGLVAAGGAQPQVLELGRRRAEPAQQRRDRLLADQQVFVGWLLAALAHGHRDAHRQPGADQLRQQRQLLGGERGDLVVAGDERDDLALGHRQRGHRVRARDRQAARARRSAEVAEVDQPADLAVVADEHVVLVRVVVDRLRGQLAQARQHLGAEARQHRRGVAARVVRPARRRPACST